MKNVENARHVTTDNLLGLLVATLLQDWQHVVSNEAT